MRPYLWLLAPLLFGACSGGNDGVYVMTLTLVDDECEENPTTGTTTQALVRIYHTTEGTVILNIGGENLPGTVDKTGLHVAIEEGYEYTGDDCDLVREVAKSNMEGTWTKDQGLTGRLVSTYEQVVDNCQAFGDDDEESCVTNWSYTATKITGSPENYPADTFSFAAPPGFDGGY